MSAKPSEIFKRPVSVDGKVIMRPDVFYVGPNKEGHIATTRLILNHGGKVTSQPGPPGSNIIALVDPHSKAAPNGPPVYSVRFINDCVQKGHRLDKELFRIKPQRGPGPSKFGSAIKRQLTAVCQSARLRRNGSGGKSLAEKKASHNVVGGCAHDNHGANGKVGGQEDNDPRSSNADHDAMADGMHPAEVAQEVQEASMADDTWTAAEDRFLIEVFDDGVSACEKRGCPKDFCRTLQFWSRMESKNLLPKRRNAKDCFRRTIQLLRSKNTGGKAEEQAQDVTGQVKDADGTKGESSTPFSSLQKYGKGAAVKKRKDSSFGSSTVSAPLSIAKGGPFKRQPKNKTQLKIFRIVKSLAKRSNVSEKNAFRALRQERGNWKKALQVLREKLNAGGA